jgi:lipopolysaccharide heptosyltransferase I
VKALLVRLSSIGDVVHTLPTLAALHRHGWATDWLVEPAARPLLEGHPQLGRAIPAPPARAFRLAEAAESVRALRAGRHDVAFDVQGLWKSAAWARLSGARRVIGHPRGQRREGLSALLLSRSVPRPSAPHVIDHNLALLRGVGIEAVGAREFVLPADAAAAESVERQLAERGAGGFAILNAGGGWASKLWPAEGFGAVAQALRQRGLPALVTWGPGEHALAERVAAASAGAAQVAFATTLREYVELARRARLVVAADTGPLHIACALGTPVVGIFGPTDPARNGPFAPDDEVVRRAPACAPCHRRTCATHAGVMAQIAPAEVLAAIDRRLAKAAGRTVAV